MLRNRCGHHYGDRAAVLKVVHTLLGQALGLGGGPMRIIACIEQPEVIEKILTHLALWPVQAHGPPAGYPLPFSLHRVVAA